MAQQDIHLWSYASRPPPGGAWPEESYSVNNNRQQTAYNNGTSNLSEGSTYYYTNPSSHSSHYQQPQQQPQQQSFPEDNDTAAATAAANCPLRIPEKHFFTKRPHKKSRNGCTMCKARKVKCDECKPVCFACKQRNLQCHYSEPAKITRERRAARHAEAHHQNYQHHDSAILPPETTATYHKVMRLQGSTPLTSHVDVVSVQLIWYYMFKTWNSFTTRGGKHGKTDMVLKDRIPKIAFDHPFMMNSLLGLTSTHIVLMNEQTTMTEPRAKLYRQRAIKSYALALRTADISLYPALAAAGLMNIVMSCANFFDARTAPRFLIPWVTQFQKLTQVIYKSPPCNFARSGFDSLFARPQLQLLVARNHIPLYLKDALNCVQSEFPTTKSDRKACDRALTYIGCLHAELANKGPTAYLHLLVFTFPTFLPSSFILLLNTYHPLAFLIIAHYSLFTKLLTRAWWMFGIADRQVPEILEMVPLHYQRWFQFPLQCIKLQSRVECIRVLCNEPSWKPEKSIEEMEKLTGRVLNVTYVDNNGRPVDLAVADDWRVVPELKLIDSTENVVASDEKTSRYRQGSGVSTMTMNGLGISATGFMQLIPRSPLDQSPHSSDTVTDAFGAQRMSQSTSSGSFHGSDRTSFSVHSRASEFSSSISDNMTMTPMQALSSQTQQSLHTVAAPMDPTWPHIKQHPGSTVFPVTATTAQFDSSSSTTTATSSSFVSEISFRTITSVPNNQPLIPDLNLDLDFSLPTTFGQLITKSITSTPLPRQISDFLPINTIAQPPLSPLPTGQFYGYFDGFPLPVDLRHGVSGSGVTGQITQMERKRQK